MDNVATLRFKKCNLFDAGRYHCKAVNPAGEATTSAELIVQGKGLVIFYSKSFKMIPNLIHLFG